ncbi:MAG TPA: PilZ domain-containing protein [Planctomycetes bacterium]|nr:PilZ domain-containing protein [Planctomycetota bacterium]HIJ70221.1 PilZ domain-containing protein [Planctomycetota bacterium]
MKADKDRRKYQRQPLRLTVLCQKVGRLGGTVYTGNTVNVSPGGLLAEFRDCRLEEGELVSIDMTVPPTEGLLDYGGRFSSYARIVRVNRTHLLGTIQSHSATRAVALEFCESPKLRV